MRRRIRNGTSDVLPTAADSVVSMAGRNSVFANRSGHGIYPTKCCTRIIVMGAGFSGRTKDLAFYFIGIDRSYVSEDCVTDDSTGGFGTERRLVDSNRRSNLIDWNRITRLPISFWADRLLLNVVEQFSGENSLSIARRFSSYMHECSTRYNPIASVATLEKTFWGSRLLELAGNSLSY